MGKNLQELERDLQDLKRQEDKLKGELSSMRNKTANKKALKKARAHKMYLLAEMVVKHCGEDILDQQEALEQFLILHNSELCIFNSALSETGYRAELLLGDGGTPVAEYDVRENS